MSAAQKLKNSSKEDQGGAHFALIEPSSGTGEDLALLDGRTIKTQNPSPHHTIPMGIGLMLLAILMYVGNDVMGKWLVSTYSVGQVLLIRSVAGLVLLSPASIREGWRTMLFPADWRMNLLRVVITTAEVVCFYWTVGRMPLADLVTIYMATPIFVTALAWAFLGEPMDRPRLLAVLVGFGGVVLAMKPTSASLSVPALAAIFGCLSFSLVMIITRHLRGTKGIVLVSWQAGGALLFGLMTAPFDWVAPSPRDFVLLAMLGVVSTIAHIAVNRSLKLAPASVVMPYQYSQIIWAVMFGYLVFGDWPDQMTMIGSGIIIAAGLFIFFREQAQAAKLAHSTP
jgi:drug/metabolite transporter (DMT)-like permease